MADDIAARLARLDACAVSGALEQLGVPASVTGLRRYADRRISDRVISAGKPPGGTTPRDLCTTAIDMAEPRQVIVVEQRRVSSAPAGTASCATRRAAGAWRACSPASSLRRAHRKRNGFVKHE